MRDWHEHIEITKDRQRLAAEIQEELAQAPGHIADASRLLQEFADRPASVSPSTGTSFENGAASLRNTVEAIRAAQEAGVEFIPESGVLRA